MVSTTTAAATTTIPLCHFPIITTLMNIPWCQHHGIIPRPFGDIRTITTMVVIVLAVRVMVTVITTNHPASDSSFVFYWPCHSPLRINNIPWKNEISIAWIGNSPPRNRSLPPHNHTHRPSLYVPTLPIDTRYSIESIVMTIVMMIT